MGQAIITANIGAGLYRIRPLWDLTALERELVALKVAESEYLALIARAIDTRDQLADAVVLAREAVAAVIQQWQDNLIRRGQEQPGGLLPDPPTDPETGDPWEDPDRAQEAPVLDALNAARTAASLSTVSRDDRLDEACRAHLRYQANTGGIGHLGVYGSKPADRATWAGYYTPDTIHELLNYGATTGAEAAAQMLAGAATEALDAEVTHAGVAHRYADRHPSSYLWAVLVASAAAESGSAGVEDDPAKTAAANTEDALRDITAPERDTLKPMKLAEVVRAFGLAQQKYLAAQKEVERLMAEKLVRLHRIADLEELQDSLEGMAPIDCWCCTYTTTLAVGATVNTMEVPGWYLADGLNKLSTLYAGTESEQTVGWVERSINIAATGTGAAPDYGRLKPAETMTAAAVAYDYALEPGQLKWKPFWRYGIITAKSGNTCTVALNAVDARQLAGEKRRRGGYGSADLDLNATATLTNIPISYPPCDGAVFAVDDEVVVEFTGFDRAKPAVIGFRREPRACVSIRRIYWEQIQ